MTKFNPQKKKTLTIGECLGPAMNIIDFKDAEQYLKDYVAFIKKDITTTNNPTNKTAEEIAKENLAYYAGYYDDTTRIRVEKLFSCSHPVFGSIKKNGIPTSEKAFEMGKTLGKKI